jgi:hypothetical protein
MRLYLSDELAARQLLIDHLAHVIKPLSGVITPIVCHTTIYSSAN